MLGKFLSSGVAPSDALQMDGTDFEYASLVTMCRGSSVPCDRGSATLFTRGGSSGKRRGLLMLLLTKIGEVLRLLLIEQE